MKWKLPAFHY